MTSEPAQPPSLSQQVATGVRWSIVEVLGQQVVRLTMVLILTRLVAPEDFGVIAMALVFTQLAALVGDLGLGPALIQRAEVTERHVATAFTVTVLAGVALMLLLMALAVPISRFYGEPELTAVLVVLSTSFLVRGIAGTPRDLLRRNMRFGVFAFASVIALVVSAVVGVTLALRGHGVWALVAQTLTEAAVSAVIVVALAWKARVWAPRWGIDKTALHELGRFGAFVSGGRLAFYGASNADNLIVGKVLGATALGFYNLAYRVMLFPILKIADVVANVTMPAFATIQSDRRRMALGFRKAVQYVGLFCFPVSIGTALAAPWLVPVVFGDRWEPAVAAVQILALNGVRLAIERLHGAVYEATGKPSWDFAMLTATFVVYVIAFLVGVRWGIEGVAIGYTVAGYALLPVRQSLVRRALRSRQSYLLAGLAPVAAATLCMAAATGFAIYLLPPSWSDERAAITVVGVAAIAYVASAKLAAPALFRNLRQDLLRR